VVALRNLVIRVIKLSQVVVVGPRIPAVPDLIPAIAASVISIMSQIRQCGAGKINRFLQVR
jgi:hypothetical protein